MSLERSPPQDSTDHITYPSHGWPLSWLDGPTPRHPLDKADNSLHLIVNIYVLDTGINTVHVTFVSGQNSDGHGHGTHCAGTAVGALHGVAKYANVIAVKVPSNSGSGSTYPFGRPLLSPRLSVVARIPLWTRAFKRSVSSTVLSRDGEDTDEQSLPAQAIDAGIFVAVAAGNDNSNAQNTSPARVTAAFTVGASTIADARASFSNYSSVVDIFTPGQNVILAWIGSTTATNNISGTSIATPHVAGVAAYLFGQRCDVALSSLMHGQPFLQRGN
ncbi:hypothetical protein M407DRAFT_30713 [Tulasnella calospora MUT 4182]|uniref:Peptidase S8/S53 domain-containing protein n=1 Tax=Tulasnella calospora MUT 4182 TaxID=1051891 RepID=A0A0C3LDU7_9AGAM|nr:hypothetical protein M407DRAFT_30713 [Tulasnella calospora MUT 4182]